MRHGAWAYLPRITALRAWTRQRPRLAIGVAAVSAIAMAAGLATALIAFEAIAKARLHDHFFSAPTRFYARSLVLAPGMAFDRDQIEDHLRRLGYRSTAGRQIGSGEYRLGSRGWLIGRNAIRHPGRLDPGGLVNVRLGYGGSISSLRDASGQELAYLALEPELIYTAASRTSKDRIPVKLSEVPQQLIDAILSIEDQRFYEHAGLDLRRIAAASLANLRAGRVVQGGSTLTQQLAKNLFLTPRRSPVRKLREAAMALVLERRYAKERILEAYLNEVYLGQDGALAIHGVGRAASHYFGKDVTQLTLDESATLAGIIRGPNLYSPLRHPELARQRRDLVLAIMQARGVISDLMFQQAQEAPLVLRQPLQQPRSGRYFVDYVGQQLRARYGSAAFDSGFAVFTTMDMRLQRAAEEAVREALAQIEATYPQIAAQNTPLQAALIALDPRSGELLAMVGGRDYGTSQFNRAVNALRQPGSSFKPIVALAALTRGTTRTGNESSRPAAHVDAASESPFTLATLLKDEPLSLETPAGLWEPDNYDGRFRGSVTLREALERSLNVPFARLGLAVGPERIVETAAKLGIVGRLTPVPSLALGASEVTPLELTRAFAVLAAGGYRADLQTTLGLLDAGGRLVSRAQFSGERVFSSEEAYLVTSALRGAVERGTGRALRVMGYRGPVAAKSGTTNDFRDGWFIGYTPSLAVGVWVGFDDGRTIGLSGSRAALPIFARFLGEAVGPDGDLDFIIPAGLELVEVNRATGLRAGWGCRGEAELFLPGTAPEASCSPYWASDDRGTERRSRWYEPVADLLRELRRQLEREARDEWNRRSTDRERRGTRPRDPRRGQGPLQY